MNIEEFTKRGEIFCDETKPHGSQNIASYSSLPDDLLDTLLSNCKRSSIMYYVTDSSEKLSQFDGTIIDYKIVNYIISKSANTRTIQTFNKYLNYVDSYDLKYPTNFDIVLSLINYLNIYDLLHDTEYDYTLLQTYKYLKKYINNSNITTEHINKLNKFDNFHTNYTLWTILVKSQKVTPNLLINYAKQGRLICADPYDEVIAPG